MDTNTYVAAAPSSGAVPPLPPILIADDDPDDLFFAMHLIKRTGTKHSVMTFDDGAGITEYLIRAWLKPAQGQSQLSPRLLFLDLKMAGLGGFAFLQWISQHPELSAIHVVVLSGSDEPEDVEWAKALGAKRYLAKHPTVATFARIIAHVYGDSAIAADSLPYGHAESEFFAESVIESGPDRPRQRAARTSVN